MTPVINDLMLDVRSSALALLIVKATVVLTVALVGASEN